VGEFYSEGSGCDPGVLLCLTAWLTNCVTSSVNWDQAEMGKRTNTAVISSQIFSLFVSNTSSKIEDTVLYEANLLWKISKCANKIGTNFQVLLVLPFNIKYSRNFLVSLHSFVSLESGRQPLVQVQVILIWTQGRNEGAKGAQFPGCRVTMGAPNHRGGAENVPTMSQVLSSMQYICFRKTNFEQGGAKRASCPGAI